MNNVVALKPADMDEYYKRMGSSLEEKLFFLDRIPKDVTVFADFGCGSGDLLSEVALRLRNCEVTIGYDLAKEALPCNEYHTAYWTPDLAAFGARIAAYRKRGHKVCLILSSVVHEVMSQGTSWFKFWDAIRSFGCEYIAIRDMACSIDDKSQPVEMATELALVRDPRMYELLLYGVQNPGSFSNRAEMLQALLKYRYEKDLKLELQEDYFALTSEQWLNLTNVGSGYSITLFDHHSVPWHRQTWKRDFGVDIPDPTHVKIVLKKV